MDPSRQHPYSNPYAYWQPGPSNLSSYYYNSHYLQAYAPQNNLPYAAGPAAYAAPQPVQLANIVQKPNYVSMSSWYQPGNHRCTYKNCTFTGSPKSVEIHMMDRHLIYPPGWDKQKKKQDWDADPSLKGKPIPIQGTGVILDTPEATAAWIAERKKRFPTQGRIEEKKRKMDEAIARGQLDLSEHQGKRPFKRQKTDGPGPASHQNNQRDNRQMQDRRRGGDRQHNQRAQQQRPRQQHQQVPTSSPVPAPLLAKPILHASLPPKPVLTKDNALSTQGTSADSDNGEASSDDDDDDDAEPEMISSKIKPANEPPAEPEPESSAHQEEDKVPQTATASIPPPRPTRVVKPRNPPRNPFATRPTLLRNLLLPEIRMTVSNLSQAIRFLVDNDFLQNVELKPGQAAEENNRIQVISSNDGNNRD